MKTTHLLLAIIFTLAGCQSGNVDNPGNVEKYVRNHEPKTGGPDL
jgi:hypothetical protein